MKQLPPSGTARILAASSLVLANRVLLRLRVRPRRDGWRRAVSVALREEPSTFVLSAFGLASEAGGEPARTDDQRQAIVAARLRAALVNEPAMRVRVRPGPYEDVPEAAPAAEYTLAFQNWIESPLRFIRPDRWDGVRSTLDHGGADTAPVCNIVCRMHPAHGVDLWIRFNHIAIDGAEAQDIITRLAAALGPARSVRFPTYDVFAPHAGVRSAGRANASETQGFFDFAPLLDWRKRVNVDLAAPMTVAAAMIWNLAQCPELQSLYFGTTVDTPAQPGTRLARGVGIVVSRPASYIDRRNGLARYVRDFNAQLERSRLRATSAWNTLDAAARLPPVLAGALLRHALEHVPSTFGHMGLTMLKDVPVFGAPLGDVGHPNGFLAVGNIALPTASSGESAARVGCITAKGPTAKISAYPALLRGMFARLAAENPGDGRR